MCFQAVELVMIDVCCSHRVVGSAVDVDNITKKLPDPFKVGLYISV